MHYYYSVLEASPSACLRGPADAGRTSSSSATTCIYLVPTEAAPPGSLPKGRLVRTAEGEEQWGRSRHMWGGASLSDPSSPSPHTTSYLRSRASVAALGRIPYSVSEGHPGGASRCIYSCDPVDKVIDPRRPGERMFHISTAARFTIR